MTVNSAAPTGRDQGQAEPSRSRGLPQLIATCHRAWAIPVLSQLHGTAGGRLAALAFALPAPRNSVRTAVQALVELGLIEPAPGHGHPLRPEVLLTTLGVEAAGRSRALVDALVTVGAADAARKKWTLPVLMAMNEESRFGHIRSRLGPITDRALTQALKLLADRHLVARSVDSSWPPTVHYRATPLGVSVQNPLQRLTRWLARL